jgi:hypothetical protein
MTLNDISFARLFRAIEYHKPWRRDLYIAAITIVAFASPTRAAILDSADINGLRTFQDSGTGRVWLDLDNFYDNTATFGTTGTQMIAEAESSGFTFATRSDLEQLFSTLPLGGSLWADYASVMGYGHPRELIWGMYDDGTPGLMGWAYAFKVNPVWSFAEDVTDPTLIQNGMTSGAVDMGIWAYSANPVPEPSTYLLMLVGLAACLSRLRKYQAREASLLT